MQDQKLQVVYQIVLTNQLNKDLNKFLIQVD